MKNVKLQKNKAKATAIKVENVSKTFRIPHEKHNSLKSAALNLFKNKSYTKFEAAKDISFTVKKGEFLGIIGRNGSGKSTLLKMLAGIYIPDKGKIILNGKLSPFLELGVGFNPELSARENIYLGGAILGLSRKEIDSKFNQIIKFAELEEFVDMKFKNFSSGMQVRLAFALSINAHAEILLMDEVLAVGDTNFQTKCLKEFRNYRNLGKTVVLVTHDTGVVQRYCDRAILLDKGKLIKSGVPQLVCESYVEKNINKMMQEAYTKAKSKITKEVEIIECLLTDDANNKKKKIFKVGDTFKAIIKFKINAPLKEPLNFNIAIRDALDDRQLLSYSTMADNFDVKNRGEVALIIKELPFLKGSYYCNVSAFKEDHEDKYDYAPQISRFLVTNRDRTDLLYNGNIYAKHNWE